MTLDLEVLPKQVLVGLYHKEGLADDDEARQLRHCLRRKMLQPDTMLVGEAAKENLTPGSQTHAHGSQ